MFPDLLLSVSHSSDMWVTGHAAEGHPFFQMDMRCVQISVRISDCRWNLTDYPILWYLADSFLKLMGPLLDTLKDWDGLINVWPAFMSKDYQAHWDAKVSCLHPKGHQPVASHSRNRTDQA